MIYRQYVGRSSDNITSSSNLTHYEFIAYPYTSELKSQQAELSWKYHHGNNKVKTSKYNKWNFLPFGLYHQFKHYYNLFFLLSAILSLIPSINPLNSWTSIAPLIIMLTVALSKDAYEDHKRHIADRNVNRQKYQVFRDGNWEECLCQDIQIGEIVKINEDEKFPVDMILVAALGDKDDVGTCYMETSDMDGETNLKKREVPIQFLDIFSPLLSSKTENSSSIPYIKFQTEAPNDKIHSFYGTALLEQQQIPLTKVHFIPRSAVLKNTAQAIGIAVYIGFNTKIFKNAARRSLTSRKRSHLAHQLNVMTLGIFIIIVLVLSISVLFGGLFLKNTASVSGYLFISISSNQIDTITLQQIGAQFILFTFMVPISLFISMEMIRLIHAAFMQWDIRMMTRQDLIAEGLLLSETNHDNIKSNAFHCVARNYNLHEDLALAKFLFSDKTGTLTENNMRVSKWYIHNTILEEGQDQVLSFINDLLSHSNLLDLSSTSLVLEESDGILRHLYQSRTEPRQSQHRLALFMIHSALCHSVLPVYMGSEHERHLTYQGQSPDEVAILNALRLNQVLVISRTRNTIIIDMKGIIQTSSSISFKILHTLEFTSDRKRMSMLIELSSGDILLLCKGADHVILERLKKDSKDNSSELFQEQVNSLSSSGLRVLAMAWRVITKREYDAFRAAHDDLISSSSSNPSTLSDERELELSNLYDVYLEHDLSLVGAVGIEDKLQEGVPETIDFLLECGIRIWLLTGDKMETAIMAGRKSHLIHTNTKLEIISKCKNLIEFEEFMKKLSDNMTNLTVLVIDGITLENSLRYHSVLLLSVALKCQTVICCRVSPIQKTILVRLVKKHYERDITIAIGDGANDVGMIEVAHIGIGIYGREGGQASRASDYSITAFRFLKRLLVVHGRYSYLRIGKIIRVSIYKNFSLILTQFFFGIFSGFSAQTVYNSIFLLLYNILFTSLLPFLIAVFEKDIIEDDLEKLPQLYEEINHGMFYTHSLMIKTIFFSAWNAIIIFFFYYGQVNLVDFSDTNGKTGGLPLQQDFLSAMIFIVVTIRTAFYTRYWVIWTVVGLLLSIALYIGDMFAFQGADYNQMYSGSIIHTLPVYYFSLLVIPCACLLPDLMIKYIIKQYRPINVDILRENIWRKSNGKLPSRFFTTV